MTDAIGEIVPFAVGVALSPLPIIAVVLLLLSKHGRAAGIMFLLGRVAAVVSLALAVALIAEQVDTSTDSSTAVAVVRIVVGVALMIYAVVSFRMRPRGDVDPEVPGWMASLDDTSPFGALRLGVVLSIVNPKELAFGVGSGLTIGNAGLAPGPTVVVCLIYAAIATASVIFPVVTFLAAGDRVISSLESARAFLIRNFAVIASIVLLVIGALLVGGGITKL